VLYALAIGIDGFGLRMNVGDDGGRGRLRWWSGGGMSRLRWRGKKEREKKLVRGC
jgi:hypothetical protein